MKKVMTTMLITIFMLSVVAKVQADDDMFRRMKELKAKMDIMQNTAVDTKVDESSESDYKATTMDKIDEVDQVEDKIKDEIYTESEVIEDKYVPVILEDITDTMDKVEDVVEEEVDEVMDAIKDDFTPDFVEDTTDEIKMDDVVEELVEDIETATEIEEVAEELTDETELGEVIEEVAEPVEMDEADVDSMVDSTEEYNYDYQADSDTDSLYGDIDIDEVAEPVMDEDLDADVLVEDTEEYVSDFEKTLMEEMGQTDDAIEEGNSDISTDTEYDMTDDMSKTDEVSTGLEVDYEGSASNANIDSFDTDLTERTDTIPADLEEIERDIEDLSIGLEEIVGKKMRDYKGN